jgi:hypothetical protein
VKELTAAGKKKQLTAELSDGRTTIAILKKYASRSHSYRKNSLLLGGCT